MKAKPFIISFLVLVYTLNIHAQNYNWDIVSAGTDCRDAVFENDTVWVATTGGLVKFLKDGTFLRLYTAKDGLSETDCFCIDKDNLGNKYIGTGRYVSKFDGKNFVSIGDGVINILGIPSIKSTPDNNVVFAITAGYSIDLSIAKYDGSQTTVSSNKVTPSLMYGISPKFDADGKLWLVNSAGKLIMFDGTASTDMTYNLNPSNSAAFFFGAKIFFDKNNVPYLNFRDKSVSKLNGTQWTSLSLQATNLTFDSQTNNMVVVRNDSIVYFNAGNAVEKKIKLNYSFPAWNQYIPVAYNKLIDDGQISWISTSAGCLKSNRTTVTPQIPASVAPGKITGMATETGGKIWVCSEDAISYLENNQWNVIPWTTTGNTYGGGQWMNIDSENKKWFGTYEGILCYDNQNWTKINKSNTASINTDYFTCSYFSGTNKWFGTSDYGVYLFNGTSWTNFSTTNGLPSNKVYSICADATGKVWIATDKGVATFSNSALTTINSLKSYLVYADSKGRIWTGHDTYVQYFDGSAWKSITNYITPQLPTFRINFGNVQFLAAKEDAEGKVWFGYGMNSFGGYFYFDGTNMVDPDKDNITYVQAPMRSVMLDKQNRIWLGALGCTVIDQNATGVKTVYRCFSSVYPAICSDFLHVKTTDALATPYQIAIYNDAGKNIFTSELKGIENAINVHDLSPGIYILQIKGKEINTHKFIKR